MSTAVTRLPGAIAEQHHGFGALLGIRGLKPRQRTGATCSMSKIAGETRFIRRLRRVAALAQHSRLGRRSLQVFKSEACAR